MGLSYHFVTQEQTLTNSIQRGNGNGKSDRDRSTTKKRMSKKQVKKSKRKKRLDETLDFKYFFGSSDEELSRLQPLDEITNDSTFPIMQ